MTPRRLFFSDPYSLARAQCGEPTLAKLVRPAESLVAYYPTKGTQVPETQTWFIRMSAPGLAPMRVLYSIEDGVGCHLLAMEVYEVAATVPLAELEFLDETE
jgi:hypothetical protein